MHPLGTGKTYLNYYQGLEGVLKACDGPYTNVAAALSIEPADTELHETYKELRVPVGGVEARVRELEETGFAAIGEVVLPLAGTAHILSNLSEPFLDELLDATSRRQYPILLHTGLGTDGILEAIRIANGRSLHICHVGSTVAGGDLHRVLNAIESSPNITCDTHLAPMAGGNSRKSDLLRHYFELGEAYHIDPVTLASTPLTDLEVDAPPFYYSKKNLLENNIICALSGAVDAIESDDLGEGVRSKLMVSNLLMLFETAKTESSRKNLMMNLLGKMTCRPAQILQLDRRGSIAPGYFADIVIFDAETKRIDTVLVNGEPALQGRTVTGNKGRKASCAQAEIKHHRKGRIVMVQDPNMSGVQKFVLRMEKAGSKIPHPCIMYLWLCLFVVIASAIWGGYQFEVPGKTDPVVIFSLISQKGFTYILSNIFTNLSGISIVAMLICLGAAVGIGEKAGFYRSFITKLSSALPDSILIGGYIFLCINGNLISDTTAVLLPPLGAMLFKARGRNPVLAIILTAVGYEGGLSANILLASTDANIFAITSDALSILPITESLSLSVSCNYFFMFVSALILTVVETAVALKITEPILNADSEIDWNGYDDAQSGQFAVADTQKRGLKFASITAIVFLVLILVCVVPKSGLLRSAEGALLPKSPFFSSIAQILFLFFSSVGIAYGYGAGTFKNTRDIVAGAMQGVRNVAPITTIFICAAQFIAFLKISNLTSLIAVKGASLLGGSGMSGIPLIICLLLLVMFINFFIGSASTKWAMLGPIFVPMFALLGYHPAFTQCIYRVGDALTNPINPLNSCMPLYVGYAQRYKKSATLGTIIAHTLPYSAVNFLIWGTMLIIWNLLNLPLGPGAGIFL